MFNKHKKKIIISSILILMPMLIGLIFWNELPETLSTHWGAEGTADGQSGKAFAVFGLPCILILVHWLCLFVTSKDKKNHNQSEKAFALIFWIMPAIAWFSNGIIYCTAFGFDFDPMTWLPIILGTMFIAIGNYMPKIRQNSTLGIKIKPTLESEANWNATHRFAGKTSVFGGLLLLLCAFLRGKVILVSALITIVFIVFAPMIYSYSFRKKQLESDKNDITIHKKTKAEKYSWIFVIIILIAVSVLMFTGDIEVGYHDKSLTVDATYYSDLTVEYSAIDDIEYRENFDKGVRTNGWGSAKLLLGTFQNDEFGSYTLYAYSKGDAAVIITVNEKKLVICGESPQETKEIFDTLKTKIG